MTDPMAFEIPIRVYFEDTDAGGVVYHANYLKFLERARTDWLREHGISQSRLKAERGLLFAIVECDVRFRAPARLDDELRVSCLLEARRSASLAFTQEVRRAGDGALLVAASVRAASLDATTFRPVPLPDDLIPETTPR
jgi:acyl-CoA thioester hydrolase